MFGLFKKKPVPVCEDCIWYRHHDDPGYARCANVRNKDATLLKVVHSPSLDPRNYAFCDLARGADWRCGPKGRHFSPKPVPQPQPKPDPYRGVLDNMDCTLLRIARTLESPPKPKKAKR